MAIQLPGLQMYLGTDIALVTAMASVTAVPLQMDGMQIKGLVQIAGNWDITTWIVPGISKSELKTEYKIGDGMTHLCLLLQVE